MAFKPGQGKPSGGGAAGGFNRKRKPLKKKRCRFCVDKIDVDYKNISLLRTFVTDKGKLLAGRITGTCPKHQRILAASIKRARMLALLPFAVI